MCVCFAGGDLHYHLSQHGVFSEKEMRFYAAEIILGLEHMHNRFVVYRDLKVRPTVQLASPLLLGASRCRVQKVPQPFLAFRQRQEVCVASRRQKNVQHIHLEAAVSPNAFSSCFFFFTLLPARYVVLDGHIVCCPYLLLVLLLVMAC